MYVVKYMYNKGEKLCMYSTLHGDQVTFGILLSFGIVLAVGSVHDYFKERMCRIKYFESKKFTTLIDPPGNHLLKIL